MSTNGVVSVQLNVSGGTPDQVELLVDGSRQALMSEPWQYAWQTASVPEGEHVLTARATKAGKTYTSPVRKVIVDRTAPTIAVRTPAAGATNVPVAATISATFSEPVNPATVTTASVTLTSGSSAVPRTVSLSADRKTLTITPSSPPVPPVTWTVALNGVTDPAGNALQPPSSAWTFAYPAWLPVGGALSAVAGTTLAEKPQLKIDPMGRPVVAWIETDGAEKNVYVRRWGGTQWQTLGTKLSALSGTGANVAELSMMLDAAGNPVIAWGEEQGLNAGIYVSRWNGTNWTYVGANAHSNSNHNAIQNVSLAIDALGNPTVSWFAWERSGEISLPIPYVKNWTGIEWGQHPKPEAPFNNLNQCYGERETSVVSSGSGLVAAFQCFAEGNPNPGMPLYVSRWANGVWQAMGTANYAGTGGTAHDINVATNPSGALVIAWTQNNSSIHVARWTGSSWQQLGSQANWNAGNASSTSLTLLPSGSPLVVWIDASTPGSPLGVSGWSGTAWYSVGPAMSADSSSSTTVANPSIATDSADSVYVAFQEGSASSGDVFVYRANE